MPDKTPDQLIAELSAIEEIKSLKNRYFRALDQELFDEVADCFSPDAVVDYGPAGVYEKPAAFIEMISEYAKTNTAKGIHQGYNPEITVTGDTASGRWVCSYLSVDTTKGVSYKQTGCYEDEFVRVDGQWLIKKTVNRPLFSETLTVDGDKPNAVILG